MPHVPIVQKRLQQLIDLPYRVREIFLLGVSEFDQNAAEQRYPIAWPSDDLRVFAGERNDLL
jgi:hypothetical protein